MTRTQTITRGQALAVLRAARPDQTLSKKRAKEMARLSGEARRFKSPYRAAANRYLSYLKGGGNLLISPWCALQKPPMDKYRVIWWVRKLRDAE